MRYILKGVLRFTMNVDCSAPRCFYLRMTRCSPLDREGTTKENARDDIRFTFKAGDEVKVAG